MLGFTYLRPEDFAQPDSYTTFGTIPSPVEEKHSSGGIFKGRFRTFSFGKGDNKTKTHTVHNANNS